VQEEEEENEEEEEVNLIEELLKLISSQLNQFNLLSVDYALVCVTETLSMRDFVPYVSDITFVFACFQGVQESLRGIKEGSFLETIASLQTLECHQAFLLCFEEQEKEEIQKV
jgi:hypothetical protein